jgi:GMP synthase-like glutamine amidotransferase
MPFRQEGVRSAVAVEIAMRLLVFQHIDCEHPGQLRQYLRQGRIEWRTIELDRGEPIPPLDNYDALWVMGGPMDVWDVEENPWLIAEKAAIRRWVRELDRPFLGLCLGHQLLADALGGTCSPQRPPEIGILEIELTPQGRADPLFADMPSRQKVLQWHSVQVSQPPDHAVVLASSNSCRVQAMHLGRYAWSMQYHVEVEPDTIVNWGAVPAYHQALEATLGPGALDRMRVEAEANMSGFVNNAERLYSNFMAAIADTA